MLFLAVALLIAGLGHETSAEVVARTDSAGNYIRLQMVPSGPPSNPMIWSPRFRAGRSSRNLDGRLNPTGDRRGDQWPSVAEAPQAPHHPWLAWSRFDGRGYSLVWSRWESGGWSATQWVHPPTGDGAQALDPDIEFDENNRPLMAWWREIDGHGTVYISVFREVRWTAPQQVSPTIVDARHPSVVVTAQGGIYVKYKTPGGVAVQAVTIVGSRTITDDINPQGDFSSGDTTTSEQTD
jgi:hypothetical protein